VLPAWLRPTAGENRIPVALAILAAAGLQLLLSPQYTLIHPRWLLASLEIALLVTLTVLNPLRLTRYTPVGKYSSGLRAGYPGDRQEPFHSRSQRVGSGGRICEQQTSRSCHALLHLRRCT
jgi:hypothetical protein